MVKASVTVRGERGGHSVGLASDALNCGDSLEYIAQRLLWLAWSRAIVAEIM